MASICRAQAMYAAIGRWELPLKVLEHHTVGVSKCRANDPSLYETLVLDTRSC